MSWWKVIVGCIVALAIIGGGIGWYFYNYGEFDPYVAMYAEHCGECHGEDLRGTDKGPDLLASGRPIWGVTVAGLMQSIRSHDPSAGMPAFEETLTPQQIKGLAIYVGERQLGQTFMEFNFSRELEIPSEPVASEAHDFHIELFAEGLDPMPFSIEPLPNGSFLLTEKERGISVIDGNGVQGEPIEGTPKTSTFSTDVRGVKYGVGWLLDVAIHPDYEENGWVYLHYTHICEGACDEGLGSKSMNRLDRGRIRDGKWVDVQTIWQADTRFYNGFTDTGAGGRLAFDDAGHVFLAVGMKGIYGPQDLSNPSGKIHRVRDDGTIPPDNPFVLAGESQPFTTLSIWTYGHRSPQGLEYNHLRGRAWSSEMGARGGDELNELIPGEGYGWPFHSLGLEYSGEYVERHKARNIEFDVSQSVETLVDITPSPAISSFVFYRGEQFPNWQDNVLIGSLKGSSLFRMVFDGDELVHQETVIKDLARIRDIEVGYDGLVYLLLETEAGSSIVRLVPSRST